MGIKRVLTKGAVSQITLDDAIEVFISEKKSLNKSNATISNYEITYKKWYEFLGQSGRSTLCKDVNDGYIYAYINYLKNEDMKQSSINHYVRDLRVFLYWCMEQDYVKPPFKIKIPSSDEEIIETYSDEEVRALIQKPRRTAPFTEWRMWAIVNWILATGNRAGTVVEVRLGDLDFTKRNITIRKTKTRKAYIIPMSTALSTVLKDYIKMWRATSGDESFLFPNIGDEQFTVNALKHAIVKYNRDRGVNDKTSIHALRHTFAKNWVRGGGDVFRLQKMLGHTTLDMTRHYVNLFSEDLKEGFDTINPLDNIKKASSRTQRIGRTDSKL